MMAHCGDGIESDNNLLFFNRILSLFCIITPYFCTVYSSLTRNLCVELKVALHIYVASVVLMTFMNPGS